MGTTSEEKAAHAIIEKLIKTIAEKEGYKDFRLEIKAITTNGANYMGDLYLIDVTEDTKDTLKLFAKVANASEQARLMVPVNKVYETEVFMYTTMADTFDEIQKKHAVPEEKRFRFPKYYGSNLKEMEELVVLENLAAQGYEVYDRLKPIDWEYAKAAVEEIAKFHALSFTFEKENPEMFAKLIKNRRNPLEDSFEVMLESMKVNLSLALKVVEKPNYGKMKKFIDDNGHKLYSSMFELSKHQVLMHGDYRMSNIMVKYKDGAVVSLKPIDYQTVSFNCPIIDLLYFLFTGSDEEFRRKHYENFFLHYHTALTNHLKLLSQDVNNIYPRSAFYSDLKDRLIFGLELSMLTLGVVLVDPSEVMTVEEMLKAMTSPDTQAFKYNDAFVKRINGVVRDYVRWGILKDEDLPQSTSSDATTNEVETKKSNAPVNQNKSTNDQRQSTMENVKKKNNKCCTVL